MVDIYNVLDYPFSRPLKTGQVTDNTPAGRTSRDDGGSQAGIPGSLLSGQYTILTTGQYAGTTAITLGSNTDNHSNNCVYDRVTGLMWSRNPSASVFQGSGTQDLGWDFTAGNNEDIFAYCDAANTALLAGYNNWRVANAREMYSLIYFSTGSGVPNSTAFPGFPGAEFWTSTTSPGAAGSAITIRFNLASAPANQVKTSGIFRCMLVRNI